MELTGQKFCCKYLRQYTVLHPMQEWLDFPKVCCQFACASVGSASALLASFRCSQRGPSTNKVGIKFPAFFFAGPPCSQALVYFFSGNWLSVDTCPMKGVEI